MLSGPRSTYSRQPNTRVLALAAGAMIHQGGIVVAEAGWATSGKTALNLTALGMADATVDNTTGANGDTSVSVRSGCFLFENSAGDPVAATSIGQTVFIEDDETIAATDGGGTRSPAGICFDVDDQGVWVTLG